MRHGRRAWREASLRGLIHRLLLGFGLLSAVTVVGFIVNTSRLLAGQIAPEERPLLAYQTRNLCIAAFVAFALTGLLELARRSFEARVDRRRAADPIPREAWEPIVTANRIVVRVYLWLFRVGPLFGLVALSPSLSSSERGLILAIGGAFLVVWLRREELRALDHEPRKTAGVVRAVALTGRRPS